MVRKDDGTEEAWSMPCLASPWNRNGTFNLMGLPAEGMQMDIRGMTVKSNGKWWAGRPMSCLRRRTRISGMRLPTESWPGGLGISKIPGVFKNQLQTSEEPYGWTFNFGQYIQFSYV